MKDRYAAKLAALADEQGEKAALRAVPELIAHLKSRGRMKQLSKIARELRRIAARRAFLVPRVEVANEKEEAHALREAAGEGITAARAFVNDSLIRGWRARAGGTLVDRSAKRALVDIYKSAVSGS